MMLSRLSTVPKASKDVEMREMEEILYVLIWMVLSSLTLCTNRSRENPSEHSCLTWTKSGNPEEHAPCLTLGSCIV